MLLATALALLITGCAQQTFTVRKKQTGSSSTKGNHHPSFLRFWNWAEENCRCSQNLWRRRKNVVKTETQQTFVNGLLGFITLGIYTRWKRVCIASYTKNTSCPSIWATLSALLINIMGSFSCFCIVISLSLEGEIIPFSGVWSRGDALSTPEAVVASRTDWQTALMCKTDDDQRGIITQSIIFSFSISYPSCILHRAQQHHADASACQ